MIRACLSMAALLLACSATPESDAEIPTDSMPPADQQGVSIRTQAVVQGLTRPVHLTSPAGDSRLFIVEQPGRIRIVENGQLLPTPFLDISAKVKSSGNEQGLLGVAFHPNYASNGYLYVNYTSQSGAFGDTQIERYRVSTDRNRVDPASVKRILSIEQPASNHNGGHLLFGPDGMLYIPTGDGGRAGDPWGNGQNTNALLGKILRIDVDRGDPYSIPSNNPFAGRAGARGEIWAYGLRNPWRIDFDPAAGLLYIADVGQNAWEEVHVAPAQQAGINYGWNRMEGTHCYPAGEACDRQGLHIPQLEYPHPDGCSIAGGYVYRGRAIPALTGHYFYGDFCGGWVRSFRYSDGRATDTRKWELGSIGQVLSFGEDSAGELYVTSMNGTVYKLVPG